MSLTGIWHLSMATPVGEQKFELDLVQHGPEQISGVSRNETAGETELSEPVLKGNKLTWKHKVNNGPMRVTATMELTFDGDSVTGTAKAGILPAGRIRGRRAA